MRVEQGKYEALFKLLINNDNAYHDRNAELMIGREFIEDNTNYLLYATIKGKTLPVTSVSYESIEDGRKAQDPPDDDKHPELYHRGIISFCDRPLEVIAIDTSDFDDDDKRINARPKWDIWLLRIPEENFGYVNDRLFREIQRKVRRQLKKLDE
jgi:hypothetical protein